MGTILVVDDNPSFRKIVRTLLRRRSDRLLEAVDGASALQHLRAEPVHLLISDVLMPDLDGYELVRQMRADPALTRVPVMFCTAIYPEADAAALALACGVEHILPKPIDSKHFMYVVGELLDNPPDWGDVSSPSKDSSLAALGPEFDRDHMRLINNKLSEKVGELESLQRHLIARAQRAEQLAATLASVGAATTLRDALEALIRGVLAMIGGTRAAARVFDPETHAYLLHLRLEPGGTIHEWPSPLPPPAGSYGERLEAGGPAELVADYAALSSDVYPHVAARLAEGVRSSVHVPIEAAGKRIGVLHVNHALPNGFGPEDLSLAQTLALQAGSAVERARLDLARRDAELALRATATDLSAALIDLSAAQRQVIQQERLRAFGEMASGIAHDFNNALVPVLGFSELLLARPASATDPEKLRSYLTLINTGAADAAHVVRRLREFYRGPEENDPFDVVDLNALARQVIDLTQPRWRDQALATGINILVVADLVDLPVVRGREPELREALVNLVFNAVDAMSHGGQITLRTRIEGALVLVSVQDEGAGMTEEVRSRALEPFFTTKGEHGTGLGLAMVYGVAQRHGGSVDITSAVGHGTTITLVLPLVAPEVTPAAPSPDSLSIPVSPVRALVVDDEPGVLDVILAFLRADGHMAESASGGHEALAALGLNQFDVVITDSAMPDMSGAQLAVEIKRRNATTHVIMLTGFGDLMLAAGERPPGVDTVVGKPLTRAKLRDALASSN